MERTEDKMIGKKPREELATWALQRCNLDALGNPLYANAHQMMRVAMHDYALAVRAACVEELKKEAGTEMSVHQRTCLACAERLEKLDL